MLCTAGKFLRADRRSRQGEVTSILCILGLVVNLISYAFYTIVVQSSYIFYNVDDCGPIMIFVVYVLQIIISRAICYATIYIVLLNRCDGLRKRKQLFTPRGFFFFWQENIDRRVQEEKNQMLAAKLEKEKDSPSTKIRARRSMVPKDEEVCIVDLVLQDIKKGSFNLKSVKSMQDEKYI